MAIPSFESLSFDMSDATGQVASRPEHPMDLRWRARISDGIRPTMEKASRRPSPWATISVSCLGFWFRFSNFGLIQF
jgi:hypothetical protein